MVQHLTKKKLYSTIQIITQIQNHTQLYKTQEEIIDTTSHKFTKLYNIALNYTKLGNTFTKPYRTVHNFTQLLQTIYKSSHTQLYTTLQTVHNFITFNHTLHNCLHNFHRIATKLHKTFTTTLHNLITFSNTLHNSTKSFTHFTTLGKHYFFFKKKATLQNLTKLCNTKCKILQVFTQLYTTL